MTTETKGWPWLRRRHQELELEARTAREAAAAEAGLTEADFELVRSGVYIKMGCAICGRLVETGDWEVIPAGGRGGIVCESCGERFAPRLWGEAKVRNDAVAWQAEVDTMDRAADEAPF